MASSMITQDILENYVFCKSKGYLQCTGEHGKPSDYAMFLTQSRDEVRRKAMAKMLAQPHKDQVVQGMLLTTAVLRHGPLFVLEARVEDGPFCLTLDGLKQVPERAAVAACAVRITPLAAAGEDTGQRDHLAWPGMSSHEGASVS
jgi:hypothetical protein